MRASGLTWAESKRELTEPREPLTKANRSNSQHCMSISTFYNSYLSQYPDVLSYLQMSRSGQSWPAESFSSERAWLEELHNRALLRDRPRLRRMLAAALTNESINEALLKGWVETCLDSISIAARRQRSFGSSDRSIPIAETLPVGAQADEIRELLAEHQVLVVAGETGSGKTTQLPKICAQLGRGVLGRIGHTQPRRLAARTVAARIAEELGVELGAGVGYQFRFESRFDETSRIKLMTDGILLAAINRDRLLLEFDTIIIDEAHERSLTIDFLLGYLRTILPKRPDLKIIITSATIDVERFATFFSRDGQAAPTVLVEGRSFPVTTHYVLDDEVDAGLELDSLVASTLDEIVEQERSSGTLPQARDVLVFLPGEREIRDVRRHLQEQYSEAHSPDAIEVLPLYARLSRAEQNKLFQQRVRARRVVLATNVAETSITVPNIGYVIDSGLARVSRYSARTKLQRLQIEKVSQASANQRAGRCGRIAEGNCYRLYSEDDFNQRAEFTDPEILRTHLAEVILRMQYLRLGDIRSFPFVDAPDNRQIKVGFKALEELGAIKTNEESQKNLLTKKGEQLARLPIDPRLAVMLLAAQQHQVLPQLLVIVAALAVVDPREFPEKKRQAAQQAHARFVDARSDFLMWLNLWRYVEHQREQLSGSQWRKKCKQEFFSWMRLREWKDVHRQLLMGVKQLFPKLATPTLAFVPDETANTTERGNWSNDYESIHRALLAGLYADFGQREEPDKKQQKSTRKDNVGQYRGARNSLFFINPGSALFKKKQRWVVAAEIVETKKVFARTVAAIEPHWLAQELEHLLKFSYGEPYWHEKRGQVMINRNAKLFGVTLYANQSIACERYDKKLARETFIREALVNRALNPDRRLTKLARFWQENERMINEVLSAEARLRRRDVMLDSSLIQEHYEQNLPFDVWSRNTLSAFLKKQGESQGKLVFDRSLLNVSALQDRLQQFPSSLMLEGEELALRYSFSPGEDEDGVTCVIPLSVLQTLRAASFEWHVPGMLHEKMVAMLKVLPKVKRRALVPAPQVAEDLLSKVVSTSSETEETRSLFVVLAKAIDIHYGVKLNSVEWQQLCFEQLDPVYLMRFEVIGERGELLGAGRDLAAMQKEYRESVQAHFSEEKKAKKTSERPGKQWQIEELGRPTLTTVGGIKVKAFPVVKDTDNGVVHDVEIDAAKAFATNRTGIVRLAMSELSQTVRYLKKQLYRDESALLGFANVIGTPQLREQTIQAAIAESCFSGFAEGLPENKQDFDDKLRKGRGAIVSCAQSIEKNMLALAAALHESKQVLQSKEVHFPNQKKDIELQLALLLPDNFCVSTPVPRMEDLVRYVKAIGIRMNRIGGNHNKDTEYCEKLSTYQQNLHKLLYTYVEALSFDDELRAFRWLLEELRVALFAQQLKTREPASFARLEKAWQRVDLHRYPEAL